MMDDIEAHSGIIIFVQEATAAMLQAIRKHSNDARGDSGRHTQRFLGVLGNPEAQCTTTMVLAQRDRTRRLTTLGFFRLFDGEYIPNTSAVKRIKRQGKCVQVQQAHRRIQVVQIEMKD